jgi:hypothetical protein
MASGNAQQRQTTSFYNTMRDDRFLGIAGATGVKPAVVAHEWTEAGLVAGDQ